MEVGILEYRGAYEGPSPFEAAEGGLFWRVACLNRGSPQQYTHGGLHSQEDR